MSVEAWDEHKETVGTIEVAGVEYELDWLFEWGENGLTEERSDVVAVYKDGSQIAEFCNPTWEPFDGVEDVLAKGEYFMQKIYRSAE